MRIFRKALYTVLFVFGTLLAIAQAQVSYEYDELGRLTKVVDSGRGTQEVYTYDDAGNRTNVLLSDTSLPSFSISDVSVTEGGSAVFTVTKTGVVSLSYSVDFATEDDTALAANDYTTTSDTLTFAAAEMSKTITVATTDDTAVEDTEAFFVNLNNATGGATINDSQGVGTINDNDATNVVLTLVDPTTDQDIRVLSPFDTISASELSNGTDYSLRVDYTGAGVVGSVQFFENSVLVKTENIAPYTRFGDSGGGLDYWPGPLPSSGFALNIKVYDGSAGSGNVLTTADYSIVIGTGETPPSFSISDVTVTEGDSAVFTVTKSGTVTQTYSVDFATVDGTADGDPLFPRAVRL